MVLAGLVLCVTLAAFAFTCPPPQLQGAAELGSDLAAFRLDMLTLLDQRWGQMTDGGQPGWEDMREAPLNSHKRLAAAARSV